MYTYYTGRTVRTAHGGAWDDYFYELLFSSPYKTDPTHELDIVGFRVATRLPEPGAGALPIIVLWDALAVEEAARRSGDVALVPARSPAAAGEHGQRGEQERRGRRLGHREQDRLAVGDHRRS